MTTAIQQQAPRIYRESPYKRLYVIGAPGQRLVKIGVADCPSRRAVFLAYDATLTPADVDRTRLEVLYQQPGGRRLELALHRQLGHRRVLGEWFDLGPIAVPLIKSLIRDILPTHGQTT